MSRAIAWPVRGTIDRDSKFEDRDSDDVRGVRNSVCQRQCNNGDGRARCWSDNDLSDGAQAGGVVAVVSGLVDAEYSVLRTSSGLLP